MKVQILAVFEENGEQVACGYRECETAIEAVMKEIKCQFADTKDALEVSASDENMTVSAYLISDGKYEVHIYIDDNDDFFTVNL